MDFERPTEMAMLASPRIYLDKFPISQAALGFLKIREQLAQEEKPKRTLEPSEKPQNINLDGFSENVRNAILIHLEMMGGRFGYNRKIILYRRMGSMQPMGTFDGEDDEGDPEETRTKRWKKFLDTLAAYDEFYAETSLKISIAEEALEIAIQKLREKIERLEADQDIETDFDKAIAPLAKTSDKDKAQAADKKPEDIIPVTTTDSATSKIEKTVPDPLQAFQEKSEPHQRLEHAREKKRRLKELRKKIREEYRKKLENNNALPDEERLKAIQAKIDKEMADISEFRHAYDDVKKELDKTLEKKNMPLLRKLLGFALALGKKNKDKDNAQKSENSPQNERSPNEEGIIKTDDDDETGQTDKKDDDERVEDSNRPDIAI